MKNNRVSGELISVLDVGSGNAQFATKMGYTRDCYLAIELNARCIDELVEKNLNVIKYDLEIGSLPLIDEAFDIVLLSNILEHLNSHFDIAKEAYRVMRPGGKLIVSIPSESSVYIWDDFTHKRGYSKKAIKEELEAAGFGDIIIVAEKNIYLTKNIKRLFKSIFSFVPKLILKYLCDIDRTTDTYFVQGSK